MKGIITKLICCTAICICLFTTVSFGEEKTRLEVSVDENTGVVTLHTYGFIHKLGTIAVIKAGDPIIYTGDDNDYIIYEWAPTDPEWEKEINWGEHNKLEPGTYCAVVFDEHNEVFVEPVYFEVKEIVATPTPTPTPTPTLPPTATPEVESTQTTEIEKTLSPTHQPTKQPTLQPTDASNYAEEENAPAWIIWIIIAAVAAVGIIVAALVARKHKRK